MLQMPVVPDLVRPRLWITGYVLPGSADRLADGAQRQPVLVDMRVRFVICPGAIRHNARGALGAAAESDCRPINVLDVGAVVVVGELGVLVAVVDVAFVLDADERGR